MAQSRRPLKVAVVGAGHFGSLHAKVYRELEEADLVAVCDADPSKAASVARKYKTQAFTDVAQLPADLDAASVAVPTRFHFEVAGSLLERGVSVLVEKPMTRSAREARALVELAESKGKVLQPGYLERFNPAIEAVRAQVLRPRYLEAIRIAPCKFRSMDIGVVMDMMIHDLDILLSFCKSRVRDVHAVGVGVLGGMEDLASVRLTFDDGSVANLSASRLSTKSMREFRIFQMDGYFSIDFQNKKVKWVRKKRELPSWQELAASMLPELALARHLKFEEHSLEGEQPLQAELAAFLAAVRGDAPPRVTGREAVAVLDVAERIRSSIDENLRLAQAAP